MNVGCAVKAAVGVGDHPVYDQWEGDRESAPAALDLALMDRGVADPENTKEKVSRLIRHILWAKAEGCPHYLARAGRHRMADTSAWRLREQSE